MEALLLVRKVYMLNLRNRSTAFRIETGLTNYPVALFHNSHTVADSNHLK